MVVLPNFDVNEYVYEGLFVYVNNYLTWYLVNVIFTGSYIV